MRFIHRVHCLLGLAVYQPSSSYFSGISILQFLNQTTSTCSDQHHSSHNRHYYYHRRRRLFLLTLVVDKIVTRLAIFACYLFQCIVVATLNTVVYGGTARFTGFACRSEIISIFALGASIVRADCAIIVASGSLYVVDFYFFCLPGKSGHSQE